LELRRSKETLSQRPDTRRAENMSEVQLDFIRIRYAVFFYIKSYLMSILLIQIYSLVEKNVKIDNINL